MLSKRKISTKTKFTSKKILADKKIKALCKKEIDNKKKR